MSAVSQQQPDQEPEEQQQQQNEQLVPPPDAGTEHESGGGAGCGEEAKPPSPKKQKQQETSKRMLVEVDHDDADMDSRTFYVLLDGRPQSIKEGEFAGECRYFLYTNPDGEVCYLKKFFFNMKL
jgi:hypothetical protein